MQFSTDLPSGKEAVRHISIGTTLSRNVRVEADAEFIAELQRTDPSRHAGLMKNQGTRKFGERWTVGTCSACAGQILDAPFVRDGKEYCSRTCRDGSNPAKRDRSKPRHYKLCAYSECARKFLAKRTNNTVCSNACKQKIKRQSAGSRDTDSCQPPSDTRINIGNN